MVTSANVRLGRVFRMTKAAIAAAIVATAAIATNTQSERLVEISKA